MKRAEKPHIPDSPPDFDDSEAFDGEKHASRGEQRDPGGDAGFVPVDDALGQGELFGEKVDDAARERQTAAGRGDGVSAESAEGETETDLTEAAEVSGEPVSLDDPAPEAHDDEDVDEALKDSFPASDPPSYTPGTASGA